MILSVSRRTDIPNYYGEWFMRRLEEGVVYVKNPMNSHQVSRVRLSPEVIDCIVFWTKNPKNFMPYLDRLSPYPYYFQFTLTGYGTDMEPGVPDKFGEMIPLFQELSRRIGKERVVWRYDPILLSSRYTEKYHGRIFAEMAARLEGYTQRAVISFLDLYGKTKRNLAGIVEEEIDRETMMRMAAHLAVIAEKHGIVLQACGEKENLSAVGVEAASCVDRELIETITGYRLKGRKDKNQRTACGCLESIDIGAYDTCRNGCRYCYANLTDQRIRIRTKCYDIHSPLLCGVVEEGDKITDRMVRSLKER